MYRIPVNSFTGCAISALKRTDGASEPVENRFPVADTGFQPVGVFIFLPDRLWYN